MENQMIESKEKELEETKIKDEKPKKKKGKKIFNRILWTIIGIALTLGFVFGYNTFCAKEEVDVRVLEEHIQKASDLVTLKVNIPGYVEYDNGQMPMISKNSFLMTFTSTANIGIDVKKVKITKNDITKKVIIAIPKAEILDVKINNSGRKYYSGNFALFKVDEKEASDKAAEKAEKEIENIIKRSNILESADKQAGDLIKGLISNLVPRGYKMVVEVAGDNISENNSTTEVK